MPQTNDTNSLSHYFKAGNTTTTVDLLSLVEKNPNLNETISVDNNEKKLRELLITHPAFNDEVMCALIKRHPNSQPMLKKLLVHEQCNAEVLKAMSEFCDITQEFELNGINQSLEKHIKKHGASKKLDYTWNEQKNELTYQVLQYDPHEKKYKELTKKTTKPFKESDPEALKDAFVEKLKKHVEQLDTTTNLTEFFTGVTDIYGELQTTYKSEIDQAKRDIANAAAAAAAEKACNKDLSVCKNDPKSKKKLINAKANEIKKVDIAAADPSDENKLEAIKARLEYRIALYEIRTDPNVGKETKGSRFSLFKGFSAHDKLKAAEKMLKHISHLIEQIQAAKDARPPSTLLNFKPAAAAKQGELGKIYENLRLLETQNKQTAKPSNR